MASLSEDLARYTDEFYTKRDLYTGLKLILQTAIELGGLATMILMLTHLLSIVSGGLSWVGLTLSPLVVREILIAAARGYLSASEEDRRAIRAVVSWINGGFSLARFMDVGLPEPVVDKGVEAIGHGLARVGGVAGRIDKGLAHTPLKYLAASNGRLRCPHCDGTHEVIKKGLTPTGKQRYYCKRCERSWSSER
jgi:hypothetical protein